MKCSSQAVIFSQVPNGEKTSNQNAMGPLDSLKVKIWLWRLKMIKYSRL